MKDMKISQQRGKEKMARQAQDTTARAMAAAFKHFLC